MGKSSTMRGGQYHARKIGPRVTAIKPGPPEGGAPPVLTSDVF